MKLTTVVFSMLVSLASVSAFAAGEVTKLAQGTWNNPVKTYSNGDREIYSNVWIDIKVKNLSYNKKVTIVWSSTGWKTKHESNATFEKTLSDGTEQWGTDILNIGGLNAHYFGTFWDHAYDHDALTFDWLDSTLCVSTVCSAKIQYAIRYINVDTGKTYWDTNNNSNYSIIVGSSL